MYPGPQSLPAVLDLYDSTWPGLPDMIERCAQAGYLWQDVSTPFTALDGDGRAVSHVGVLDLPLRVGGTDRLWAGIHAVCTRPAHRKQGHSAPLMRAALDHIDRGPYAGAFLTTENPALFTRYGFTVVGEHRFVCPRPASAGTAAPARPLSEDRLEDLAVLRRVYRGRLPLSDRLAARDSGWMTAMCELLYFGRFTHFVYAEAIDAVIAAEVGEGTLQILDVACAAPLRLADVCAHIPGTYQDVALLLNAERLAPGATPVSAPSPDDTVLMVRGADLGEAPVALPQLSRC